MNWISVKDRLPEPSTLVLVYCKNAKICVPDYIFSAEYIQSKNKWIEQGCGCCHNDFIPTHWMPLPKGPKE